MVKKSDKNFLLLLLTLIDDKLYLKDMAKKLGKTKQALNYHLRKLKGLKMVVQDQTYPFAIYRLTDLGSKVKQTLIQSDDVRLSMFRVHSGIIGFDIKDFGEFKFINTTTRKMIPMENWKYAREITDGYVVNVQDTGLLKLYVPEKYSTDPDLAIGQQIAEVSKIAQWYCDKYNMKLKPLRIIRQFHKELQRSEQLAKIFGKYKDVEKLWTDASGGTENLEEPGGSNSIEDLLSLPKIIREELRPVLLELRDQIKLHLEATREWKDTAGEIRDAIKQLPKQSIRTVTKKQKRRNVAKHTQDSTTENIPEQVNNDLYSGRSI